MADPPTRRKGRSAHDWEESLTSDEERGDADADEAGPRRREKRKVISRDASGLRSELWWTTGFGRPHEEIRGRVAIHERQDAADRSPWLLVQLSRLVARPSALLGVQDALDAQLAALYDLQLSRIEAEIGRRHPPGDVEAREREKPGKKRYAGGRDSCQCSSPSRALPDQPRPGNATAGSPGIASDALSKDHIKAQDGSLSTERRDSAPPPDLTFLSSQVDLPWMWKLAKSPWDFAALPDEALAFMHSTAQRAARFPPFAEAWNLCLRATLHLRIREDSPDLSSPRRHFACSFASPGLQGCSKPLELHHAFFPREGEHGLSFFGVRTLADPAKTGRQSVSRMASEQGGSQFLSAGHEARFARGCVGVEANAGGSVCESVISIPGMRTRLLRVQSSLLRAAASLRSSSRDQVSFLDAPELCGPSEDADAFEEDSESDDSSRTSVASRDGFHSGVDAGNSAESIDGPIAIPCQFAPLLLRPTAYVPESSLVPALRVARVVSTNAETASSSRERNWMAAFPNPPGYELVLVLNLYASCVAQLPERLSGEEVPLPVHVACTVVPLSRREEGDREVLPFCEALRVPFDLPVFLHLRRLEFVRCRSEGTLGFKICRAVAHSAGGKRKENAEDVHESGGGEPGPSVDAYCDGGFVGGCLMSGRGAAPRFALDGGRVVDWGDREGKEKVAESKQGFGPMPPFPPGMVDEAGRLKKAKETGGEEDDLGGDEKKQDGGETKGSSAALDSKKAKSVRREKERRRRKKRVQQLRKLLKEKLGEDAFDLFESDFEASSHDGSSSEDSSRHLGRRGRNRGSDSSSPRSPSDAMFGDTDSEAIGFPWLDREGHRDRAPWSEAGRRQSGSHGERQKFEKSERDIEPSTDVDDVSGRESRTDASPTDPSQLFDFDGVDGSRLVSTRDVSPSCSSPRVDKAQTAEEQRQAENQRRLEPLTLSVESFIDEHGRLVFSRGKTGRQKDVGGSESAGGPRRQEQASGRDTVSSRAPASATESGSQKARRLLAATASDREIGRLGLPQKKKPPGYETAQTRLCMQLEQLARGFAASERDVSDLRPQARSGTKLTRGEKRCVDMGENEGDTQESIRLPLSSNLPLLEVEWKGIRRRVGKKATAASEDAYGGDFDGEERDVHRNRFLAPLYLEGQSWEEQQRLLDCLEKRNSKERRWVQAASQRLAAGLEEKRGEEREKHREKGKREEREEREKRRIDQREEGERGHRQEKPVGVRERGEKREKQREKGEKYPEKETPIETREREHKREELRKVEMRMQRHKPSSPLPRLTRVSLRPHPDSVRAVDKTK
ncbi:hypothetical protein TGVAND_264980 [Toxoplasma gondii VAND]|uniref:Uncharacterized protein n=1 Tax=Toxoplasma gondii VAND TaxID=933077 RepID=A0A086PM22_TOXGO|nr:hypothetical protein TGVAND_264980 [Toxoplasma gondii VAND]